MQKGEKLNFQKMTETTSSRIQREMLILEKKNKTKQRIVSLQLNAGCLFSFCFFFYLE